MDCKKITPLLSAYIDDELSATERVLVEEHLPLCPDCARRLEKLKAIAKMTQSLEEVTPPAAFSQKLRQAVKEEIGRLPAASLKTPVETRMPWWRRITPRAALGYTAAVAGLLILLLFLNTLPQKTRPFPAVSEKAAPQYAKPLGNSAEMGDLAGRPVPQIGVTDNDYTPKDITKKFRDLAIWKKFGKSYSTKDVLRFQAVISRYVIERVRPQGENALSLIKSLGVALPPPDADFVALPSYLEKAKFNHKKVWIVVLNWQKKDGEDLPLNRGQIHVVNLENQEILFSSIF